MLHFFPTSFLDETLYGRMSRYHRLAGSSTDRASLRNLIGLHTHVITSGLPSKLNAFVSRLPLEANVLVDDLIANNTLYPYYTAFLPAERHARVAASMRGDSVAGIKMYLGLIASRLGGHNNLRFCRCCFDADREACGQAYWHRAHQLPGVLVCPVHEEPLYALGWPEIQMKRHKLLLPDDAFCAQYSGQAVLSQAQHELALSIARLSDAFVRRDVPGLDAQTVYDVHRSNAARRGLIRSNGRIYIEALNQTLASYCANMPTYGEYLILRARIESWALKLLRKSRGRAIHPMTHIALLDCLGDRREVTTHKPKDGVPAPAHPGVTWKPLRVDLGRLTEMISVQNFTLSQAAAALDICVTTAAVAANRAGLSVSSRAKTITDDLKSGVGAALRLGLCPKEVATKHGISLVSVYRILRMDANLEQEFEAKRLELAREQYRNRFLISHSDKASYAWLRRHDAAWLVEQVRFGRKISTTHAGVNWECRDKNLSQQIIESEADLHSRPGKPVYISEALLKRLTKMSDTIDQNIDRLPLTHAALKKCSESPEGSQRRRLIWAGRELEQQLHHRPPRWQLLRLAGVRIPYLQNQDLIQTLTSSSVAFLTVGV
nr:TnsD family Tn7-like transposition protein [uncultured Duganella sp.]